MGLLHKKRTSIGFHHFNLQIMDWSHNLVLSRSCIVHQRCGCNFTSRAFAPAVENASSKRYKASWSLHIQINLFLSFFLSFLHWNYLVSKSLVAVARLMLLKLESWFLLFRYMSMWSLHTLYDPVDVDLLLTSDWFILLQDRLIFVIIFSTLPTWAVSKGWSSCLSIGVNNSTIIYKTNDRKFWR